jgi:hypothetical protein
MVSKFKESGLITVFFVLLTMILILALCTKIGWLIALTAAKPVARRSYILRLLRQTATTQRLVATFTPGTSPTPTIHRASLPALRWSSM